MGRKLVAASIGAVLAGVAAGTVGVASASSGSSAPGQTITVVQRAPDIVSVDLGATGPSPGDVLEFRSDLYDETDTSQVGDLHIHCTENFGPRFVCLGIFTFFGRGQMAVDALPQFPLPATGMVTGGTDEFQRVRGEAHIEPQSDGTTRITFHLFG